MNKIGGYPTDLLLCAPVNSVGLICACCLEVLCDPVQCTNGHLFCRTCICEALRFHSSCPTCRCYLDNRQLIVSLLAKQMVSVLKIKCLYSKIKDGSSISCKWKGTISDLDSHLTRDCQLQTVECTTLGCSELMSRHSLANHQMNLCQMRLVACPYCTQTFAAMDLAAHTFNCSYRPVQCEYGCTSTCFPFNEIHDHYRECLMKPVKCPYYSTGCHPACNGWVPRKAWEAHTQEKTNMNIVIGALFDKVAKLERSLTRPTLLARTSLSPLRGRLRRQNNGGSSTEAVPPFATVVSGGMVSVQWTRLPSYK